MIALFVVAALALGGTEIEPAAALADARKRFEELDYRGAIDSAQVVLDATAHDALSDDDKRMRLSALFIQGYSFAVTQRSIDAQEKFRAAVEIDVDAEPDFAMEVAIQSILDGVRAERRKGLLAATAERRKALVDNVVITVRAPLNLTGGNRAIFLVDVGGSQAAAVKSMRIDFKTGKERELYGLPVVKQKDGVWRGEIPGAFTKSKAGMRILWFVTAVDDAGLPIKTMGTREAPNVLEIDPGSDIALDLKANERLSQPARFLYALFGAPTVTSAFFLASAGALGSATLAAHSFNATALEGVLIVFLALGPAVAAPLGTYLSTQFLLDDYGPWVPTAGVAIGGLLYAVGTLIAGTAAIRTASNTQSGNDSSTFLSGGVLGAGGIAIGFASAVILPPLLVALDNPSSEPEAGEESVR